MTDEIRVAIDRYFGDMTRSDDEVRAGLAEVVEYAASFVAAIEFDEEIVDTLPSAVR